MGGTVHPNHFDAYIVEIGQQWGRDGEGVCNRVGCTRMAESRLNIRVPDPTAPLAPSRDAIAWTIRHRCGSGGGTERLAFCAEHLETAKQHFGSIEYRRYVIAAMRAQGRAPGGPETCRLQVEPLPSLN